MFYIEVKGKRYRYSDMDAAVTTANKIHASCGIIVGIFREEV